MPSKKTHRDFNAWRLHVLSFLRVLSTVLFFLMTPPWLPWRVQNFFLCVFCCGYMHDGYTHADASAKGKPSSIQAAHQVHDCEILQSADCRLWSLIFNRHSAMPHNNIQTFIRTDTRTYIHTQAAADLYRQWGCRRWKIVKPTKKEIGITTFKKGWSIVWPKFALKYINVATYS